VNNAATNGALLGVGAYFCHEIMAQRTFELLGTLPVNVILMGTQVCYLRLCYQACLSLGAGEGHPYSAPQPALMQL